MMSTKQVFTRAVIYALVLSALDAVSGRFFQAHPDPNILLFMGATAWASYRLAQAGPERLAVPAGLALFMGQHVVEYGLLMAGSLLSLLPVIAFFLIIQRSFVSGIATTGLK